MLKYKKNTKSEEIKNLENELKTNNDSAEDKGSSLNDKENPVAGNETPDEAFKGKDLSDKKKLEDELEKKIKEIETLTDTMKRRQADFENYKKRMIKSQDEQKKLAIRDFAIDIININDDLLRAFEASCSINREKTVDEVCNTFSKGFSMISKSVEETLKKYGIEEIDSLNKAFDPNCNEAIETEESGNVDCDTITKVHQKGFRLGEYVLRSSRVKVSKPKKSANNTDFKTENNNPENEPANTTGENINIKV